MLYSWGTFTFDTMPVNVDGYEDVDMDEWAKKEILGIMPPRESTGQDDQELVLQGKLYPRKMAQWGKPTGLSEIEQFRELKRARIPQNMTRGDGKNLGWYVCTRLVQKGSFLAADGVGQVIAFEAQFFRQPIPDGTVYFSKLYQAQSR
jgi:phage protein U